MQEQRTVPPRSSSLAFRAEIRSAYLAATRHTQMNGRQLDHMEEMLRLLLRIAKREGPDVHRTWRQLVRGLGWAPKGITVAETHNRFKSQLHNTLGYLETAGFVTDWHAIYEGKESTGILIRLGSAPVAQPDRAPAF